MTDLSPQMKQACEFYRRFVGEEDGLLAPPKGSREEQHALQTLAAYIDEGVKNATGVAVGETPTVHRMAEVLDYITAYDAFNVDTPDGATTDLSSPMNAHRRLLMHVFAEAMAARNLVVYEEGSEGPKREIVIRDLVLEGDEPPRLEVEIAPPSDEQIKRAMLIQMRQAAEKQEPGYWRDHALAQCDGIAAMDMDDPDMQEGLAMGRVFLGLVYQPLTTEAPNGDEE